MKILLAIVLCLVSCVALAAQPTSSGPRNALISWEAATQNTDGSPITGTIKYRIYRGKKDEPKTLVAETSLLSVLLTQQPIGNMCYVVTTVVSSLPPVVMVTGESVPSAEGCKVMVLDAPSDGSIERPTDGSIETRRR